MIMNKEQSAHDIFMIKHLAIKFVYSRKGENFPKKLNTICRGTLRFGNVTSWEIMICKTTTRCLAMMPP